MSSETILTAELAMLIGLYELAAGFAGLTRRLVWTELLSAFEASPALTFVTGFVAFTIGGAMVLVHNEWTGALAIIVSLIGWIALIEGLLIMAAPGGLLGMSRSLVGNQRGVSLLALLVGACLFIAGLVTFLDNLVIIKLF